MFPGRRVVVSLSDGDRVRGVTRWSWSWLRLRDVSSRPDGPPDVAGLLLLPPHAVLSVQVIPKEVR